MAVIGAILGIKSKWLLGLFILLLIASSGVSWLQEAERNDAESARDKAISDIAFANQSKPFFDELDRDGLSLFPRQNLRLYVYVMNAYEWGGYRGSENFPPLSAKIVNPLESLKRPVSPGPWNLVLGLFNGTDHEIEGAELRLELPEGVEVSGRQEGGWQPHKWAEWLPFGLLNNVFTHRFGTLPAKKGWHSNQPLILRFEKNGDYVLNYVISSKGQQDVKNTIAIYVGP